MENRTRRAALALALALSLAPGWLWAGPSPAPELCEASAAKLVERYLEGSSADAYVLPAGLTFGPKQDAGTTASLYWERYPQVYERTVGSAPVETFAVPSGQVVIARSRRFDGSAGKPLRVFEHAYRDLCVATK